MEVRAAISSTANRYAIVSKLASGGMAELFLARTESSAGVERYVVLKRVLGHRVDDIAFVNMFLDEARLAALLQHPNIAQVYDTGKLDDSYFFTMEYVHGETVRDLLRRAYANEQQIPVSCVLTIVAGAAAGLAHAHERLGNDGRALGIVHRDVSPSNLMVSYEGNVKVVDFGVAKATHRSVETDSGTVKGKMGYMAPEQCKGGNLDLRADLFSLGIVFWELLVGDRLFKRATDFDTMDEIVNLPSPAPSSRRPEVPPAIDAIVLKLLQKSPADRYASAHEVVDAIEAAALASGTPISVSALRRLMVELFGHRPEPWLAETSSVGDSTEQPTMTGAPLPRAIVEGEVRLDRLLAISDDEPSETPIRRRRWWPLLVGALAIAATVTVFALGRGREPAGRGEKVAARANDARVAEPDAVREVIDASIAAVPQDAQLASVDAPARSTADELALAMREGRHADVIAACASDKALVAKHAVTCTLAACREHATETARTWWKGVAKSERSSTLAACRALGVALKSRPVHTPADTKPERCDDPMACRK